MKNKRNNLVYIIILVVIGCLLSGCNGSFGPIDRDSDFSYAIQGVFIQDLNTTVLKPDTNFVAITLQRDTSLFRDAQLFFGNTPLIYSTEYNVSDSVYTFSNTPRNYLSGGSYVINVSDSTLFSDTISINVLDSISITSYLPDSTIPNTNGQQVTIEWTSALNIDGYIVAVVLADSAYQGKGYATFVTDLVPSTTITPDAFRANPLQASPDTGWYNIYIYGYSGSPDSALSSMLLPVPFPANIASNIAHNDLSGRFGSIIVSKRVPVYVVSQ